MENKTDLINDPRFIKARELFNSENWYPAHDAFEELWHEIDGPERLTIQGLIQVAVAQVHLANGNTKGATILYGEGLGRLKSKEAVDLGLDINQLCDCLEKRLARLQTKMNPDDFSVPILLMKS